MITFYKNSNLIFSLKWVTSTD